MSMIGKRVIVTTKHRGVFFGTLASRPPNEGVLTDVRLCIYWDNPTKGFIGLAASGPMGESRLSDSAPSLEIVDVTAIVERAFNVLF